MLPDVQMSILCSLFTGRLAPSHFMGPLSVQFQLRGRRQRGPETLDQGRALDDAFASIALMESLETDEDDDVMPGEFDIL